ncbi:MAG: ribosome assembly RNA-binding protein YhbY [Gammaproteobacteria bacterium]|nr:ribosome assembly RNA-binding protein YhbY [Gammaproteobacteria bacterium]
MPLSNSQLKHLQKLTHHLKPVISIGQNGITDNVLNELDIALNHHELVKIKIAGEDRDARQAMIQQLCDQTSAEKIQAIGKTLTLFRRNPEKPKIQF